MTNEIRIEDYLPRFLLNDRNGYAMAKAIEQMMIAFDEAISGGLRILTDIDSMPEWRLDEMAWETNAQWYDYDAGIEEKRAQIKAMQEFYDCMGTPLAVTRAISAIYGTGRVEEWFEYGGEPYHFSIYTTNQSALLENRAKFLALLENVKNLRSVLDNIYYYGASASANAKIGTAMISMDGSAHATAKLYGGE